MKPETEWAAQKRKKQTRRGPRGGDVPLSWARIAVQNICKGEAILEGESPGLMVGGKDRDFFMDLEVQGPFFD